MSTTLNPVAGLPYTACGRPSASSLTSGAYGVAAIGGERVHCVPLPHVYTSDPPGVPSIA